MRKYLLLVSGVLFCSQIFGQNCHPDFEPPFLLCRDISAELEVSNTIQVSAAGYIDELTDNCVSPNEIIKKIQHVDINGNPLSGLLDQATFTCDNIGMNYIKVWVFDGHPDSSNANFCITVQEIQDLIGICEDSPTGIRGLCSAKDCATDTEVPLRYRIVEDDGNIQEVSCEGVLYHSYNYPITIEPIVDQNNHLQGVTTFDILRIRQHLLNARPFTNDCQRIAADINNDTRVSTSDILFLRQLILGHRDTFPQTGQPWVVLDSEIENIEDAGGKKTLFNSFELAEYAGIAWRAIKVGNLSDY